MPMTISLLPERADYSSIPRIIPLQTRSASAGIVTLYLYSATRTCSPVLYDPVIVIGISRLKNLLQFVSRARTAHSVPMSAG
jgi:hypothetical protein